jgi:hypothetical protein
MRIPGADQAIGHLIKWSEKDEWEPYRRQVFAEHFDLITERFDISEQEIVDLLDMVCGFVLEDFFTARFGRRGRTERRRRLPQAARLARESAG